MSLREHKCAVIISIAAHVALIGLLFWGAAFFRSVEFGGKGGGGGVVSVWVAGAGDEIVAIGGKVTVRKKVGSAPGAPSAGATGGVQGEGVGQGEGAGVGSGSGGNPIFAEIWKKINRAKYYPEFAKRQGLEGSPRVTFSINAEGRVESLVIASSCGEKILDDAAIETVRRGAPYPFFSGPITVAVRYSLRMTD